MSKVISTSEARRRFAEITDEVRQGKETYSIVRHGKEVARIVPPHGVADQSVDLSLDSDIKEFVEEYGEALTELARR